METNKKLDELFEGIKRPLGTTPVNIESAPKEVADKILPIYSGLDISSAIQYPKEQVDIRKIKKFENAITLADDKILRKFFNTLLLLNSKKDIEDVISVLEKLVDVGVFDDEEEDENED